MSLLEPSEALRRQIVRDRSFPVRQIVSTARILMPKATSRKTRRRKRRTTKASATKPRVAKTHENDSALRRTLVVDIGGSGIKATVLNDLAKPITERLRRESPSWACQAWSWTSLWGSPMN